ncbi:MAG TPA: hypothetical protein VIJ39_05560 [Solirubrobacteraceae bacterium]
MATAAEIKQRTEFESDRRARLSVPAAAGGVLFLLSGIILNAALKELPTVGIVQGLEPALHGEASPAISPRAAEVKFIDHHAFNLIAGNVLTALAILALTLTLLFIQDSTRFRRPQTWPLGRPLVLVGGIGYALLNLIHEVTLAIEAHKFASGTDFSSKAVERALLTSGSLGIALTLLGLIAALALTVGMIAVMVGSLRAGLLPRWLSMFGILAALLFLPLFGSSLVTTLIPTLWLAATGFLLWERWPSGDPPAWAAGEARPWPSQSGRAKGQDGKDGPPSGLAQRFMGARNGGEPAADLAPPPTPVPGGSRRKRRKRG